MAVKDQTITRNAALYNGDAVEVLRGLPDEKADFTLFSPPFADLYCYSDSPNDLGNWQCRRESDPWRYDSPKMFRHGDDIYLIGRRLAADRARGAATVGAAIGALLLAFAPLFWGHSLIAEVYTLHLFLITLVLWLMLRWRNGEGALPLAALVFGVGLGNHITLTFMGPAILLLLWSGRERITWRGVVLSVLALAVDHCCCWAKISSLISQKVP